jgi:hypothetical protein
MVRFRRWKVNLGYINKAGALWTDASAWGGPNELARQYVEESAVVLGFDVQEMSRPA